VKEKYISVKKAANYFGTKTTNIRYLLDYHPDKIHRYDEGGKLVERGKGMKIYVSLQELENYYEERKKLADEDQALNGETNPDLSFRNFSDSERTKHVHGLHSYMGKFIPQLANYYLSKYFKRDQVILDPFAGSGTTLIEANSLSMHSIGIDIAKFNTIIMGAKLTKYDLNLMEFEVRHILHKVTQFSNHYWKKDKTNKGLLSGKEIQHYRQLLIDPANSLDKYFSDSDASMISNRQRDYNLDRVQNLFRILDESVPDIVNYKDPRTKYLEDWLAPRTNIEVNYYQSLISNYTYQDLLRVILSSAIRSSRLIKHIDLTRPKEPLKPDETYICKKHRGRRCKPITQALKWMRNYSVGKKGAINRIKEFSKIRTNNEFHIIHGDSTSVNIAERLLQSGTSIVKDDCIQFIDGVFTSPPYVGIIDYHDQHIYAYEIFDLEKNKEKEIGAAQFGSSKNAQKTYQKLIADVLINTKPFLKEGANVFIVANDRYDLYPQIFKESGYLLKHRDRRGVYKRADAGGARSNYQETIFQIVPEKKKK